MSNVIQYAYVSGELSPKLYSRSDLEKFDLGLALARDWFVDYRGGISTRPGTEFKEWQQFPNDTIRWFPFEFSSNVANTNFVIFGNGYIRFTQEGNYILETAKTVTALSGGVVTIASHGYTTGDLGRFPSITGPVSYAGRLFEITVLSANTFSLKDQFGNTVTDATAFVSGTFARVYTLPSPYTHTDLPDLNVEQIRDTLRLTHYGYKTRDLTRVAAASWTLGETVFNSQVPAPSSIAGSSSSPGSAGVVYAVTAVDYSGAESLPSASLVVQNTVNFTVTAGSFEVFWSPVPGTAYYNVYRSTVAVDGARVTRSMQLGFLGRAYGTIFLDTNIIPNFTKMPPQFNNPFEDGAIRWINVASSGTGYTTSSVLSITDPTGTGFSGYAVISSAGQVLGAIVVNGGKNYTAPVVNLSIGTGTVFTTEVGPVGQNYPAVSAVFQQRQVYAGTLSAPLGIWGSRPKRFNNFDTSSIVVDNDSYDFEVDAAKVSLIRHLFPTRGGLLVMNNIGIWQLSGGNQNAVTPTNALAEPQSFTGISNLTPIRIETDVLYVESKGYTVRQLAYNDLAKLYAGTDISILSSHFFGKGKEIISWTYAQEPYKLVHAIREDGYRLLGTVVKDQNIFAWTLASTKGFYKQAITVREDRLDRVYLDVVRTINGKTVRYIEQEAEREFTKIEDAWGLDCALALTPSYPDASLMVSGTTATASAAVFSPADIGAIIFAAGGKVRIETYISTTQVTFRVLQAFTSFIPQTTTPIVSASGSWTKDQPVTVIRGLWHLEGETVSILGDGNVFMPLTVVNGTITLPIGVVRAIIGISYKCVAQTLPATASGVIVEGKRKRVVGVATRVNNSRGLKTGSSLTSLYEAKDRTVELAGEPILPHSDMRYSAIEPEWNTEGQTYFVVEDPLPVSILGHVLGMEVGDD
jgi:hypothetical protein